MYKRTQIGKLMIGVVGTAALALGLAGIIARKYLDLAPFIILMSISGILLICLILFSTLSVKVENDMVIVKYGIGLVRKKFLKEQIIDLEEIEYMGVHGWGPRLTSEGWFFNVKNSGAVKLYLKNSKIFFIGTDDSNKLSEAIKFHS